MKVHSKGRKSSIVHLTSTDYRTLTGGQFQSGRTARVEIPLLLSEDVRIVQAVTEPLRFLFPSIEWDEWGIEIVEGNGCIAEVLIEEQTLLLERRGLDHSSLLAWEAFGAFLQAVMELEFEAYLKTDDIPFLALVAQLSWFAQEGIQWQGEILTFLIEHQPQNRTLGPLLWSILPQQRAEALEVELGFVPPTWHQHPTLSSPTDEPFFWTQANYLLSQLRGEEVQSPESSSFASFQRAFSICSLLPWEALCSALPGMLVRYFHEIDPNANSTERRLGLFRIVAEQCLRAPQLLVEPMAWPRMSLLVLDPDRHPKIYQALLQFLELTFGRKREIFWPTHTDETVLAQLALQNQLSEQDDRFFRQATHLQAIWRDILHRSASQEWASLLLFDYLEAVVSIIEAEPDLLFAAVIWNRAMWEAAPTPIAPPLQNLRELLWILSQAPLAVLRRMYPEAEAEVAQAHARWPLLRTHLKRFLHLAPPILSRLCDQLEEEQGRPAAPDHRRYHFDVDADPDIPQQELHGRILPLLARPDIKRYNHIDFEATTSLRVLHLDRFLHQSSGLWKEHRFFSSFLLLFKNPQNQDEGGWAELALWIDKDLDLGKVANKKGLSSTIRGLLLEDGIWERTYRYQFLTVGQLMTKLNPSGAEWTQLLQLLGSEYASLLEQRLREVLDYQYYMMRGEHLGHRALTSHLDDADVHPLWRLRVEEFEAIKHGLAGRMCARILQEFYETQLQDDRCWNHAHQSIAQRIQDVSALLRLAPGSLPSAGDGASALHHACADVIESWVEQPDAFAALPQDAEAWLEDKKALLHRLHRLDLEGAMAFVRFLLQQFNDSYRVVELLMKQPLEEESQRVIFKPIPTSHESAERQKEFVPFLRNADGQLLTPAFLQLFSCVPRALLHTTLRTWPGLLSSLQRVAFLVRDLDFDEEQHLFLWDALDEFRDLQKPRENSRQLPPNAEESLPPNLDVPKESSSPD